MIPRRTRKSAEFKTQKESYRSPPTEVTVTKETAKNIQNKINELHEQERQIEEELNEYRYAYVCGENGCETTISRNKRDVVYLPLKELKFPSMSVLRTPPTFPPDSILEHELLQTYLKMHQDLIEKDKKHEKEYKVFLDKEPDPYYELKINEVLGSLESPSRYLSVSWENIS